MPARHATGDHPVMPLQQDIPPFARPTGRRAQPAAPARRSQERPSVAHDPVDLALDLLEQHRLSPMELRILLGVRDRERSESKLARRLGHARTAIRRSAGSLYARGLVRWRYLDGGDDSSFSLTPAGKMLLRSLAPAGRETTS
jgi:DNA-binding MarR family transcriptional regulator